MPLARFEPTIQASERLQTHALDYAATGVGVTDHYSGIKLLALRASLVVPYLRAKLAKKTYTSC
jgi:hypothetical protein